MPDCAGSGTIIGPGNKSVQPTRGGFPFWHGIARADVFLTEDGPTVCELNCDTPTGEAEAVLLNGTVTQTAAGHDDPNRALGKRFCAMVAAMAGIARRLSVGIVYPTEMPEDLSMVLLYRRWFEERGWQVTLGSPFNLRRFPRGRAGLSIKYHQSSTSMETLRQPPLYRLSITSTST